MREIRSGDKVRLRYRGLLEDGSVFGATEEGKSFEVVAGAGRVIPGFDRAIVGMKVGERKSVGIPAEEAYGPYRRDLRIRVERKSLGKNASYRPGQEVRIRRPGEQALIGRVVEVGEDEILVDANHPLAGKRLTFEIEIVEVL
jgi:peptidylprolyl isomerase